MKNEKKLLIAAIVLPLIFIIGWIIQINFHEQKLNNEVKIAVHEYDPRSLFSGNYMSLIVSWDETDCTQFANSECPKADFDETYKFFMPEEDAKLLDIIIRRGSENIKSELVFNYAPGEKATIKTLLLNSQEWPYWLAEHKK